MDQRAHLVAYVDQALARAASGLDLFATPEADAFARQIRAARRQIAQAMEKQRGSGT